MSESGRIPAAILAGGDATDRVARAVGVPCKALAEIEGRPLVSWVADALDQAETVGAVVAVEGPTRALSAAGEPAGIRLATAAGPGFMDTMMAAAHAYPDAERILVATGDLPLLRPEVVDGFVRSCQGSRAEVSYPLVREDEFDRAFPGRGKFAVPLREGRFIGTNLVLVTRRFILEEGPVIADTFARRKSVLGMCRMFGWGFVLRLALRRLGVADVERRAAEMLGTELRAIPTAGPEIAFDVDNLADLELARRYFSRRRKSA